MSADMLTVLTAIIALTGALLAWFIIDAGSTGFERYKAGFTANANFRLREFFLFIDPRKLFIANVGLIVLAPAGAWLLSGSPVLAAIVLIVLIFLPRAAYAWMRYKRLLKFEEQLPDALMMISGGLRAGLGLSSAIQQLVTEAQPPLSQEFSLLLREQRLGLTLEQSLSNLGLRMPVQTTLLVVSAMRVASETGGSLAETLERTANTLRSRLQMEGKIRALTSQGKLQGWVVGLLPVGLMFILDRIQPDVMAVLWHTHTGWGVLCVVAFLEAMGIHLIRKIVSIDV